MTLRAQTGAPTYGLVEISRAHVHANDLQEPDRQRRLGQTRERSEVGQPGLNALPLGRLEDAKHTKNKRPKISTDLKVGRRFAPKRGAPPAKILGPLSAAFEDAKRPERSGRSAAFEDAKRPDKLRSGNAFQSPSERRRRGCRRL